MKTLITAVITYLATSIDEIPILFILYKKESNKGKGKTITVAYFIGTFLLIALGLLGALGLVQLPQRWIIGLIGLVPLFLGIKILIKGDDDEEKAMAYGQKVKSLWAQVLLITMAMGADDLGVYIPLFTTLTGWEILQMLVIFFLGVALICLISFRLTRVDQLSNFIESRERFIIGILFMAIGIYVMIECGSISGIVNLFK